jgi:hypothetical protein
VDQAAPPGPLDRVGQVAPGPVGLPAGGGVPEGEEQPAAVAEGPEQGEVPEGGGQPPDPPVADGAVLAAGVDGHLAVIAGRPQLGRHPGAGVVGKPGQAGEPLPLPVVQG